MTKAELEKLVQDYDEASNKYEDLHRRLINLVLDIAIEHNLVWDRRFICESEINVGYGGKITIVVYDSDRDSDSATLSFDEIINPSLIDIRLQREKAEKAMEEEQQRYLSEKTLFEKLKMKFEPEWKMPFLQDLQKKIELFRQQNKSCESVDLAVNMLFRMFETCKTDISYCETVKKWVEGRDTVLLRDKILHVSPTDLAAFNAFALIDSNAGIFANKNKDNIQQ